MVAIKTVGFSKAKVWFVFIVLFICGLMTGVGISNWKNKNANDGFMPRVAVVEETCTTVERVLLNNLHNDDEDCDAVREDEKTLQKLVKYGCDENRPEYQQVLLNKQAILNIACDGVFTGYNDLPEKPCLTIEKNLQEQLGDNYPEMDAEGRIKRAKIYAIMSERGCPENAPEYVEAAKRELEIARGISDDKFDQDETIDVVETYKRLQMQNAAEEIFNKAKKLTNPAIDFIMQVEKVINE